jgi:hypothetical protein
MAGLMVPRLSMLPAWVKPDGFSDPNNTWTNETLAYDDNTATCACEIVSGGSFGNFIYFTFSSMISNKLRYFAEGLVGTAGGKIDIDVLKDGVWIDVYYGSIGNDAWQEKTFSQGTVTQIRIRFENLVGDPMSAKLMEISLWQVLEEQQSPEEQPPEEQFPSQENRWALPMIVVGLAFIICGAIVLSKRKP